MTDARGSNFPPSNIEYSGELTAILGAWLKDHPIVDTEEVARSAKLLIDRGRLCLQDMEAERKTRVGVFQTQIRQIDDEYRAPKTILDKVLGLIKDRVNDWIKKEEAVRQKAAEEARQRARTAEKAARAAEEAEQEAISDAKVGVESDIGSITSHADAAFAAFQRAEREAMRADNAVDVKIGGGFGRALSTRFKETLVVEDPLKAVSIMGWSERLIDALRTDAREYRKQHGQLPHGIVSHGERKI